MSGNGHTDITENTDFNWSLPIELRSTSNATRQYSSKLSLLHRFKIETKIIFKIIKGDSFR